MRENLVSEHPSDENYQTLALSEVSEGAQVEIVAYRSNGRLAQRLAELGLTPGTLVCVLRCSKSQPLLIRVRGTRLAIDRNSAESLRVRQVYHAGQDQGQRSSWHRLGRRRRRWAKGDRCDR
jgi:Fe2+ transport system protein FeoA